MWRPTVVRNQERWALIHEDGDTVILEGITGTWETEADIRDELVEAGVEHKEDQDIAIRLLRAAKIEITRS